MYHPGYYATPGAFRRDYHTTNQRFRVWEADAMKRPVRRRFHPHFLHGPRWIVTR